MLERSESVYSPRENDIFIAYSPQDDFFAKRLEKAIIKLGRDPWIDTQDLPPGMKSDQPEAWQYIHTGIKNADVFVFLLSPASIASKRNQRELELAVQYQKRLIPILYQPVKPDQVPRAFHDKKITWIFTPPDDPTANVEEIATTILHIHIHQRLLIKATEWDNKRRHRDLLLYGTDLAAVKQWFEENTDREPALVPLQHQYLQESARVEDKHHKPKQIDLFISYSRRDRQFVEELCKRLKVSNLNIWVDWENIPVAADWRQEIQEGIEAAHTFLFVISPDSVASTYCHDEVAQAVQNNKRIISIVWRNNYDRDAFKRVPALTTIRKYNWLQCDSLERLDSIVPTLIKAIYTDLDYVKTHTRLLLQAIEWKHQERKEEFLLRKTELVAARQFLLKGKLIEQHWLQTGKLEALPPTPLPTPLQEEFVQESARVEANHARLERSRRIRNRVLVGALLFFLGLTATAILGQMKALNREVEALVSSLEGVRELDALINGLRAGQQLDKWGWAIEQLEPDLKIRVVTALQQQIYNLRERNRLLGHTNQVYNVSLSPDGRLLASASADGTVRLWNHQGKQIQVLQPEPMQKRGSIVHVLFNPGIESEVYTLASAGDSGTVYVWKIWQTPNGTWDISLDQTLAVSTDPATETNRIFSLSFSHGGRVMAAASGNTVTLWRREQTGQFSPLTTLKHSNGSAVLNVSFSRHSQGERLASADSTGTIKILTSQDLFSTYKSQEVKHGGRVLSVSFSPDGQTLASGGDDNTVKLWNLGTDPALMRVLEGHEDQIYRVLFSPDGEVVASASEDSSVRLWKSDGTLWEDGSIAKILRGHQAPVYRVQFSPDSQTIASAGADDTIRLWARDGTLIDNLEGHQDEVLSIEFTGDGRTLASSSKDKTIRLWKIDSPVRVLPHTYRVYDLSFTSDGMVLASSGEDTIRFWRAQDGTPLLNEPITQQGTIASISFAPSDTTTAAQGQLLAAAGQNGTVNLWKLERTGDGYKTSPVQWMDGENEGGVYAVSFNSDGQLLASAGAAGIINLWKVEQRNGTYNVTRLLSLKGQGGAIYSVRFSPSNQLLAAAGQNGTIQLWRLNQTDEQYEAIPLPALAGHEGVVHSLAFNPDGQTLATAGQDGTVKLWHVARMSLPPTTLRGHGDEVMKVRFSPNGELLASASRDDTVKLWTIEGHLITTLRRHRREVSSISFSPDGEMLASASYDARALLWELSNEFDLNQFLVDGCNLAQEYLLSSAFESAGIPGQYQKTLGEVRDYCHGLLSQEHIKPNLTAEEMKDPEN